MMRSAVCWSIQPRNSGGVMSHPQSVAGIQTLLREDEDSTTGQTAELVGSCFRTLRRASFKSSGVKRPCCFAHCPTAARPSRRFSASLARVVIQPEDTTPRPHKLPGGLHRHLFSYLHFAGCRIGWPQMNADKKNQEPADIRAWNVKRLTFCRRVFLGPFLRWLIRLGLVFWRRFMRRRFCGNWGFRGYGRVAGSVFCWL